MAQTSADFFTNVSQGSPGSVVWSNLNNILAAPDFARCQYGTANPESSQRITLDTPLSGAEIPVGKPITAIEIIVNADSIFSATNTQSIENLRIGTGNSKSASIPAAGPVDIIFSGDLAYWGINESEAANFASGTVDLTFQTENDGDEDANRNDVEFVTAQFTYSGVVPPPVMF